MPTSIIDLMASRTIPHVAPALAELAVTIGALDPADRRTQATLIPIVEMLTRISPTRDCRAELRGVVGGGGDGGHFGAHASYPKSISPEISQRARSPGV